MVSDEPHDLPVYAIGDLPQGARHLLLTPSLRWRVVTEQVSEMKHDVILESVVRLRQAGETSAGRIADLLQLPDDLVRHLLSQSANNGITRESSGMLVASSTRVGWVYRDIATGELWPDIGMEAPALPVRYTSRYRGRFDRGTAGRPVQVDCLVLQVSDANDASPTSMELARFTRASSDPNRRTAIIGPPESCLVASPVTATDSGPQVQTTGRMPHITLSQRLAQAGRRSPQVSRWLAGLPRLTKSQAAQSPLARALLDLRATASEVGPHGDHPDPEVILSKVDLCLSRYVDEVRYTHRLEAASPVAGEAEKGSHPTAIKVRHLLQQAPATAGLDLRELDRVTSWFTDLATSGTTAVTLNELVTRTLTLCEHLIETTEALHGEQER